MLRGRRKQGRWHREQDPGTPPHKPYAAHTYTPTHSQQPRRTRPHSHTRPHTLPSTHKHVHAPNSARTLPTSHAQEPWKHKRPRLPRKQTARNLQQPSVRGGLRLPHHNPPGSAPAQHPTHPQTHTRSLQSQAQPACTTGLHPDGGPFQSPGEDIGGRHHVRYRTCPKDHVRHIMHGVRKHDTVVRSVFVEFGSAARLQEGGHSCRLQRRHGRLGRAIA